MYVYVCVCVYSTKYTYYILSAFYFFPNRLTIRSCMEEVTKMHLPLSRLPHQRSSLFLSGKTDLVFQNLKSLLEMSLFM